MGKQTNIKLRGTVANIIFYQWKGIHCIRTVPARVRQTRPTKKAASDFGRAVRSSATVRAAFRQLMPTIPADRSVIYKTDGAFRKWLQGNPLDSAEKVNGIGFFDELSFNDHTRIKRVLNFAISANRGSDGDVLIQWPAFNPLKDIKAPTGTTLVVVNYVMVTINMNSLIQQTPVEETLTIPYTDDKITEKEILFPNATGEKCLALLGMSIRYYRHGLNGLPVNIMRWKPAGVAASFYN